MVSEGIDYKKAFQGEMSLLVTRLLSTITNKPVGLQVIIPNEMCYTWNGEQFIPSQPQEKEVHLVLQYVVEDGAEDRLFSISDVCENKDFANALASAYEEGEADRREDAERNGDKSIRKFKYTVESHQVHSK